MFMGYPTNQWVELIQYSIFMLVLFIGIGFVSVKLDNIFFEDDKYNDKINKENSKKKQWFYNVA